MNFWILLFFILAFILLATWFGIIPAVILMAIAIIPGRTIFAI
jgi:hypothetical protein